MSNKHVHPILANVVEDIKRFSLPPRPAQWAEETVYIGQLDYTVPAPVAAELASLRRQLAAETELYCDVRNVLDSERQKYLHRGDQRFDTIQALRTLLHGANDKTELLDGIRNALRIARGYE